MTRVLLFKDPLYSREYSQHLSELDVQFHYFRPYKYERQKLNERCKKELQERPGIILASQRAVKFFQEALAQNDTDISLEKKTFFCPGEKTAAFLVKTLNLQNEQVRSFAHGIEEIFKTVEEEKLAVTYLHSSKSRWSAMQTLKNYVHSHCLYTAKAKRPAPKLFEGISHLALFAPSQVGLLPEPSQMNDVKILALGKSTISALNRQNYPNIYPFESNSANGFIQTFKKTID